MQVSDYVFFTCFPAFRVRTNASSGRATIALIRRARIRRLFQKAVSLVELLIVVAVIGVMAAVAIPMMNAFIPAQSQVATRNLNYLNGAVVCYNQAATELSTNTSASAIMQVLKARDTLVSGSPFLPSNLKTNTTSDSSTYRATWTGRMFELLPPGTNGTGFDLLKLM